MSIFIVAPVHADINHGYTGSWDYGGESSSGDAYPSAVAGWGYMYIINNANSWARSYLNSAAVQAQADVDNLEVTVVYVNPCRQLQPFYVYAIIECRLYVNSNFVQMKQQVFGAGGYEVFNFYNLDIDEGDYLDIDIAFEGQTYTGYICFGFNKAGVSFDSST